MSAKEFGLWVLLTLLWGCSYVAIDIGLEAFDPFTLVSGRMIIGALMLVIVVFLVDGSLRLSWRGWAIATTVGLTGNVFPFLLISFAEQHVNSGLAALLMGVAPIVTLAVAPLIHTDETLGPLKVLGAAAGFGGVLVLVGPEALSGLTGDLVPKLALVLAALCYAFTTLFARRFAWPNARQMAAASVLVGALAIASVTAFKLSSHGLPGFALPSVLALAYLGVGSTGLAAILYFHLVPRIGATRMQQTNYVIPVLGTLLGIAVLGEEPDWNTWLAIPLILLGVYLVSRKQRQRVGRSNVWAEKAPAARSG
ncbi:DMT family transporter [Roseibium sp.]|uniref:DMT family transporter n=1 Tax=Roseibium sp. TaxID=1936156 RepID=UPI003D1225BE